MLFATSEVTNCEFTVRILDLSITKWTLLWAGALWSLARRLATLGERKEKFRQNFRPNCMRNHGLSFRFAVRQLGYTSPRQISGRHSKEPFLKGHVLAIRSQQA